MNDPKDILTKANADYTSGRYKDAADGFRKVLDIHPDIGELYINYGVACRAYGNLPEAESAYRNAIRLLPENALAWFNLGNLLNDLRRSDEALHALQKADVLQPGTPEILNNIGIQHYARGEIESAVWHYEAALIGNPDFADVLTNYGNALQRLYRLDEAQIALERALELSPDNPTYRLNMSTFLAAAGRHDDALYWANQAIKANPAYSEAQLKRASLLIQQGNLKEGFAAYEKRWEIPGWHPLPSLFMCPMWRGEDIAQKHLLVWNEQGYGDALMYARYLPMLSAQGARVTFLCEVPLMRLMQESLGSEIVVMDLAKTPPFSDYHISIMSLPHLMGTEIESIPHKTLYLSTTSDNEAYWQQKLNTQCCGKFNIGLIWAGNPQQSHDYTRSIEPELFAPIAERGDIDLVNLLIGPRGDQWQGPKLIDLRLEIENFADTAAIMRSLDLIISVDSAPAHLAGGLGVPVWTMLAFDPDTRFFLNSNDCPWYPSAKLFRQTRPGDWSDVISAANSELNALIQTKAKS